MTQHTRALTGIAAQAARGQRIGLKRGVEYRSLPSKSILNRCSSGRMPFRWTVNPYRGCEIGCHYCYATYTHAYLGIEDPGGFSSLVFSKENARGLLTKELARGVKGPIAIGTSTDPYQPAERRFETTRGILQAFAKFSGNEIGITTKSDLILRDLDLLGSIAANNDLHVNITVTTMDDGLARMLEPRSVIPPLRIEALRELRWRGISAGIFSAPVLPLLTDSVESLRGVARAAKRADAQYWHAHPLFLRPDARERMLPFLEREHPEVVQRYRRHYGRGAFTSQSYRKWLSDRVEAIRRQLGLGSRVPLREGGNPAARAARGPLFAGAAA